MGGRSLPVLEGWGASCGALGPWSTRPVEHSARGALGPWSTRPVEHSARGALESAVGVPPATLQALDLTHLLWHACWGIRARVVHMGWGGD
eukprot:gene7413-biopygen9079